MMWLVFASGYALGWLCRKLCQEDQARKFGILNVGGMKFVRMYEVKK